MPDLRTPDVRVRGRRLDPMRRGRPALLLLLVALLGVGGCGGNEIAADEVPGSPPTLSLPPDEEPAAAADSGDPQDADEQDADEDADAATGAATDTGAGTDTGAATAPAAAPTAAPETGGAGGDEQQFEDFCNQNPGAC